MLKLKLATAAVIAAGTIIALICCLVEAPRERQNCLGGSVEQIFTDCAARL